MLKSCWSVLGVSSLVFTVLQLSIAKATASELEQAINQYSSAQQLLEQVNSVSQLRDVSPEDWAYEALRSLTERYGCIAGFPNGTYQGKQVMTRYEFAAGLNSCLQQIERLIAASKTVLEEDIQTLQRLIQEFEVELATIGSKLDNLEGRVAFLEDHQFSTTTKLVGEVVFAASGAFGDEKADASGEDIEKQIVRIVPTQIVSL